MKLKRTRHDPEFEARKRLKEAGLRAIEYLVLALRYPKICSSTISAVGDEIDIMRNAAAILDPEDK